MARKKTKKIINQLEFDFELKSGVIQGCEFDFYNQENNFFGALYESKSKLQVDLLRFSLADKVSKSRKPIRRVLFFNTEQTRKRVALKNRSIFKKCGIETSVLK